MAAKDYQKLAREFAAGVLGCNLIGVGMSNPFSLLYCIRRSGYSPIGCDHEKMATRWRVGGSAGGAWIEFYATHYRITPADYITTAEGLEAFESTVMGMLRPVLIDGVAFNFLGVTEIDEIDDPEFPDPLGQIAPPPPSAGDGVPTSCWTNRD